MLDATDKTFIEKAVKNNARIAIGIECRDDVGDGNPGSIYKLVSDLISAKWLAFFGSTSFGTSPQVYQRLHDTVGEELQKGIVGTADTFAGVTRAALVAAVIEGVLAAGGEKQEAE